MVSEKIHLHYKHMETLDAWGGATLDPVAWLAGYM